MNARDFRAALAKLGLSQAEVAQALGRSKNTVTAWINADNIPAEGRLFCRVALDHGLDYAKEALRS